MENKRAVVIDKYKKGDASNVADFSYFAGVDTVSWKRPGQCRKGGIERMDLNIHKQAGWVQISAAEGYEGENGRFTSREIMLCLHHNEAVALRDFLNANLPESLEKE